MTIDWLAAQALSDLASSGSGRSGRSSSVHVSSSVSSASSGVSSGVSSGGVNSSGAAASSGGAASRRRLASQIGSDDLEEVLSPLPYPFSALGLLVFEDSTPAAANSSGSGTAAADIPGGKGSVAICTGFLVSPNTVLTAAHCLQPVKAAGGRRLLAFIPSYSRSSAGGNSAPLGRVSNRQWHASAHTLVFPAPISARIACSIDFATYNAQHKLTCAPGTHTTIINRCGRCGQRCRQSGRRRRRAASALGVMTWGQCGWRKRWVEAGRKRQARTCMHTSLLALGSEVYSCTKPLKSQHTHVFGTREMNYKHTVWRTL